MIRPRSELLASVAGLTLFVTISGCQPAASTGSTHAEAPSSADTGAASACPAAEALGVRHGDPDSWARMGEAYRSCFENTKDPGQARKSADAYVQAALLASQKGDVRYTREVSELLVQLQDKARLQEVFGKIVDKVPAGQPDRQYIALVDYADALASLHDESAWSYFERAIELRPGNNVEAINRYARHLIDQGQPQKAVEVLETRMTAEQRIRAGQPAYLRQEAMRRAGLDTSAADAEIAQIQGRRTRSRPPR